MPKVAMVRVIVLRHSGEECWRGIQLCTIVGIQAFQFGHICNEKPDNYPCRDWISEEFDGDLRDQIDAELKDKPIGFYEILADFHFEGSTDYWGEYDCHSELRNISIKPTIYKQAVGFDDRDFLRDSLVPLVGYKPEPGSYHPYSDQMISPYMPKRKIVLRQAALLDSIVNEWTTRRTDFRDMDIEQLQAFSFMAGLEIQTIASKEGPLGVIKLNKLEQINRVTEEVLREHDLWMVEEKK